MIDVPTMLGLYYRRKDRSIDTKEREGYSFLLIMLKGLSRDFSKSVFFELTQLDSTRFCFLNILSQIMTLKTKFPAHQPLKSVLESETNYIYDFEMSAC